MSATHVLVTCPECAGTGNGTNPLLQCDVCMGGGKLNLPRDAHTGGAPPGLMEWKDHELGPLVLNPLLLRTDR